MTSILDKIRSFHLNTNKRSTALDNLNSEHSSQWRQNAHSVTPHTHFNFYNSISIIISILNLLWEAGACHMNLHFHWSHSFIHYVLNPLYCRISPYYYYYFCTLGRGAIMTHSCDLGGLFAQTLSSLLLSHFLTLSYSFILPFSDQSRPLSLLSFKTWSTGFVLAMSWCVTSCWLLVMFSQNIHSALLSYVQSHWILG